MTENEKGGGASYAARNANTHSENTAEHCTSRGKLLPQVIIS